MQPPKLVYREEKGAPLTADEADQNLKSILDYTKSVSGQIEAAVNHVAVDEGEEGDSIILATDVPIKLLEYGMLIRFAVKNTNETSNVTIELKDSELPVYGIVKKAGAPLEPGDLRSGAVAVIAFDAAQESPRWRLVSSTSNPIIIRATAVLDEEASKGVLPTLEEAPVYKYNVTPEIVVPNYISDVLYLVSFDVQNRVKVELRFLKASPDEYHDYKPLKVSGRELGYQGLEQGKKYLLSYEGDRFEILSKEHRELVANTVPYPETRSVGLSDAVRPNAVTAEGVSYFPAQIFQIKQPMFALPFPDVSHDVETGVVTPASARKLLAFCSTTQDGSFTSSPGTADYAKTRMRAIHMDSLRVESMLSTYETLLAGNSSVHTQYRHGVIIAKSSASNTSAFTMLLSYGPKLMLTNLTTLNETRASLYSTTGYGLDKMSVVKDVNGNAGLPNNASVFTPFCYSTYEPEVTVSPPTTLNGLESGTFWCHACTLNPLSTTNYYNRLNMVRLRALTHSSGIYSLAAAPTGSSMTSGINFLHPDVDNGHAFRRLFTWDHTTTPDATVSAAHVTSLQLNPVRKVSISNPEEVVYTIYLTDSETALMHVFEITLGQNVDLGNWWNSLPAASRTYTTYLKYVNSYSLGIPIYHHGNPLTYVDNANQRHGQIYVEINTQKWVLAGDGTIKMTEDVTPAPIPNPLYGNVMSVIYPVWNNPLTGGGYIIRVPWPGPQ